ncbi:MAG: carboxypeptidase regulatory-like domain-containing protein [Gemmatimonadaceae bacterium]
MFLRRWILGAAVILGASPAAAQTVDVIRGRVTGPENQPVEGVEVTVTTLSGAVSRSARTDRNGRYMVTFPGGDGDYFVNFRSLGYAPRRYEIKRVADEDILVADARLQRTATQLGEVRVTAPRGRPGRNDPNTDVSGTERTVNPGALAANQMGDLAAMAASMPGVLYVPGQDGDPSGFSVFGLSADQNSTTLNGQNFGGADLPRDAAVSTSLSTSPYDVSRGGFSGGNLNLRTRSGTNFIVRSSSLNIDAPQMQWTDRAAQALGQQYSNLSFGGLLSGPIRYNHAFYSTAYQVGRRSNDLQTMLNTDPVGLRASGIAMDSVSRLLGILGTLGVPATVGGLPSDRLSDQGSLMTSIDIAPPSSRAGSAFNLTINGSWNRQNPVGGQITELPAHSGRRTNWNAGVQGRHSTYFGFGALSETAVSLGASRGSSEPFLDLPSGSVRINSSFADGTNGVKTVTFGGSPFLNTTTFSHTLAFTNLLSWFSENNRHRLKLSTELRRDGYDLDQSANLLGSFFFSSLADLESGVPGSFSRQLQPRTRSSSQIVGAISLGDSWRATPSLQVQYGLRADGNVFGTTPNRNRQVEALLGLRNDRVPNGMYVSPRVGFSWTYGRAAQVGGFDGAFRGPRAVVRGGIGVFQGTPGTQLTGSALDNTGLPGGLQQLNCAGLAVPNPQWAQYLASQSAIPAECADGSRGTVFASSVPNVSLFASSYTAPRSLRSNLSWSGPVLGNRFTTQIEGTFSLNLNQQGFVDRNLQATSRFVLASEGSRPVFVQPTSIDPATGLVAARDARITQSFNRVTEQRSDLRSESRQLRVSLSPATFNSRYSWSLSYVHSNVREQVRGFNSNTVGNPFDLEWARSNFDARHQIQYSLNYNAFDLVRVNWFGNVRSGAPFTPLVAGDVNGDGFGNDRAFVFDPATAQDPALASSMQMLMAASTDAVRGCLTNQLGALATRNSCSGPWTHNANLSISFNPLKVRMPQRATLSLAVSNPLGAADLLLHGSGGLRGWGQNPFPDQNLLFVRGFDRAAQRFRYDVNQRFGSTNPQFSAFRTPVTVTAMMRFDIGPTREKQALTQQLNLGRSVEGNKMPEQMIKAIYGSGGLINPLAQILRQADTLQLTVVQADSLATLNRWYLVRVDSIWSPIAKHLAGLPDDFDAGDAYGRYRNGRRATVDLLRKLSPHVKNLLSDAQRRKLPVLVTSYLDPRYLAAIRSGTAGAGGAGLFPGGPMALPGGGGGQAVTIVR